MLPPKRSEGDKTKVKTSLRATWTIVGLEMLQIISQAIDSSTRKKGKKEKEGRRQRKSEEGRGKGEKAEKLWHINQLSREKEQLNFYDFY